MTTAKPPARYGAIWGRAYGRLCSTELHHHWGVRHAKLMIACGCKSHPAKAAAGKPGPSLAGVRYSQYQRKVRDFVLTLALFSTVSVFTVLLAGSFAANLLHDIYVDRRRQYATLMALGFSPAMGIAPALAFGLMLGITAAGIGGLVARILVPRSFAMPSLMADLGPTEPTIDWLVAASIVAIAIAAVVVGLASTSIRLVWQPLATTLSEENS